MSISSATILLILIMNPLGNLPLFLSELKSIDRKRHAYIIIRETFFAYVLLIIFMFFGQFLLRSMQITEQALGISGGIILLIIAIRMLFSKEPEAVENKHVREPFFVPFAIPLMAGPGALTTVMLLFSSQPEANKFLLVIAVTTAAASVGAILLGGDYLSKYLGKSGLIALEKLSGMMLAAMAVQMLLTGISAYFKL